MHSQSPRGDAMETNLNRIAAGVVLGVLLLALVAPLFIR